MPKVVPEATDAWRRANTIVSVSGDLSGRLAVGFQSAGERSLAAIEDLWCSYLKCLHDAFETALQHAARRFTGQPQQSVQLGNEGLDGHGTRSGDVHPHRQLAVQPVRLHGDSDRLAGHGDVSASPSIQVRCVSHTRKPNPSKTAKAAIVAFQSRCPW